MIDPEKFLPPPFSIEGPELPPRITAIGEAEKLEARAERCKDPQMRQVLLHRAYCFRQLAEPGDLDWDLQVCDYRDEIEDRMKACLILREHSILAELTPWARIEQHIKQLAVLAESGTDSEKFKAASELWQIAELAAGELGVIARESPELLRPIAEGANFFPMKTNAHSSAEAKRREEICNSIGLATDAPRSGDKHYTDLKRLVWGLFDYIRAHGGDYALSVADVYRTAERQPPRFLEMLAGIDPWKRDKEQWKEVALEILRYSYGSLANLPVISGIKQGADQDAIESERRKIKQEWIKRMADKSLTESEKEGIEAFFPPTREMVEESQTILANQLGIDDLNQLEKDMKRLEEMMSPAWRMAKIEEVARNRISECWNKNIPA